MHKLAVAFFYSCAVLSITVTALVFADKASEQPGGSAGDYSVAARVLP